MTDKIRAVRRPVRTPLRTPLRQRSRRRWAVAGGAATCWLAAELMTGSAVTATVVLMAVAGLGVAGAAGLRTMGVTRDHPWLRRMAARPWRDGQDVLNAAMRHLPDVLVITPSGSLLAPDVVELQMNSGDLASLRERMELDVVSASATEVYEDLVAERGARFAGSCRPEVYVVPDYSVPRGRYRLRQGIPVTAGPPPYPHDPPDPQGLPDPHDPPHPQGLPEPAGGRSAHAAREFPGIAPERAGRAGYAVDSGRTTAEGVVTVMERTRPAVPVLRLVTGSSVAETSMSGARAGRGAVELVLPRVPTVSREHARFTFSAGRWRVTNHGMNGLSVNGVPVSGSQPLSDGDSIRWGTAPDALLSRVEIG